MSTIQERILEIEAEVARTQVNKNTNGHLGLLRAKIARLKRELLDSISKGKGGGEGFEVAKNGDARIGLVGFPSVGKSTLLSQLTGTESEIAAWEFTTLTCIPGVLQFKGSKMQLLDLPGIVEGAKDNKGKGKQIIAVARTCNLILIVLDATRPAMHKKIIENELEGFGIRLNKKPPMIKVRKKEKGGVDIIENVKQTKLSHQTIKSVMREYKYVNANIYFDQDADIDALIDALEGNRQYIPCIYVLNKIDAISMEELRILEQMPHFVPVSGLAKWNFEELLDTIWDYLGFIRVYTKPKGQIPDYDEPVILPRKKSKISDFCRNIHRDMIAQFKYAYVWGRSVKHCPQKVGKDHILQDEDIVQILKKN